MTEIKQPKKDKTMLIVGINVIIMIMYTLLMRFSAENTEDIIVLAFLLAVHIILCLIISPFIYSKGFLLSALTILLIGFSTCYAIFGMH